MKKLLLLPALFCFHLVKAQVQSFYERSIDVGVNLGANWFFGDVGGKKGIGQNFIKDWNAREIKPSGGLSIAYNFNDRFCLRTNFFYSSVAANDSTIGKNDISGRYERNQNFQSNILEASAGIQYTYRTYDGDNLRKFAPFIYAGVGVFHFNPKSKYNGQWIALQPLHTEGQQMAEYPGRSPYKLVSLYLPVAFGFNYDMNDYWSFRTELIFRKSFTDYIDDASTTYVDPALFDKYFSGSQATLAKYFSNRSGERLGTTKIYQASEIRGSPKFNDTWVTLNFSLIYNIRL